MCDRDNKVVHIAEEMGITPKVPDGGYDARVLERMRTYDQNEPINLSNLLYYYASFGRVIFRLRRSMSKHFDHKHFDHKSENVGLGTIGVMPISSAIRTTLLSLSLTSFHDFHLTILRFFD